jgi:N,N'-diacetyllegionaminate synthase
MTQFIAEIGGNHQGEESRVLSLTKDAIGNGVKILKYQIYTGESLVSEQYDPDRVAHFTSFTLGKSVYREVINMCIEANVEFMASIWSKSLLDEFDPFVQRYKIGSGDLTNYPLIKLMAERGKPIILSTGLSEIEEVDAVVDYIRSINDLYHQSDKLSILQCTSVYPCPLNEVNLSVVDVYRRRYNSFTGYSHHTIQYSPIYAAISMGVDMIEFHYTDTKHDNNFRDHLISVDASEYKKILAFYEETAILRGRSSKAATAHEKETGHTTSFRRSLFYKHDFPEGHCLAADDLDSLRPAIGVSSSKIDHYIGIPLAASVLKGEVLIQEHFDK